MLRSEWLRVKIVFVSLAVVIGLAVVAEAQYSQITSAHFIVYYETTGKNAVPKSYAELVSRAMERAYEKLIVQDGFPLVKEPVQVFIRDLEGLLGSAQVTGPLRQRPRINMALPKAFEDFVARYLSYFGIEIGLETSVSSTAAHELFHIVQASYDPSEKFLIESTARWAEEEVVPEAFRKVWDFFRFLAGGSDLIGLENWIPAYSAGPFWIWLTEKYGGAALMKKIWEKSIEYDGPVVVEAAMQEMGTLKSLLDLWEEFSAALATKDFKDGPYVYERVKFYLAKYHMPEAKVWLPFPINESFWQGGTLSIEQVNNSPPNPWFVHPTSVPAVGSPFLNDPVGAPLRVAHAYGIDFVRIVAQSPKDLLIVFDGDDATEFRVNVVLNRQGQYIVRKLSEAVPVVVKEPNVYEEIYIVLTRGEAGTGKYKFVLAEAPSVGK